MHAYVCVPMVENDEKCLKIIKNIIVSAAISGIIFTFFPTVECIPTVYEEKLSFFVFRSNS